MTKQSNGNSIDIQKPNVESLHAEEMKNSVDKNIWARANQEEFDSMLSFLRSSSLVSLY